MTSQKWLVLGLLLALQPASHALASKGGEGSGGGDLCEDRIKLIRDDLKSWIFKGGPRGLTLPAEISAESYSESMIDSIKNARVKCVGAGDRDYPVAIDRTPKVCKFENSASGGQIICDYRKFLVTPEADQYVLVHHEYAGLSGIEMPNRDDSHYEISNQISGYLEDQVVNKLAIKASTPLSSRICTLRFWYGSIYAEIFKGKGSRGDVLADYSVPYASNKQKGFEMIQLLQEQGQCERFFLMDGSSTPAIEAPAKCVIKSRRTMSNQPLGAVLVTGKMELIEFAVVFKNQEKVLEDISKDGEKMKALGLCSSVSFDL